MIARSIGTIANHLTNEKGQVNLTKQFVQMLSLSAYQPYIDGKMYSVYIDRMTLNIMRKSMVCEMLKIVA